MFVAAFATFCGGVIAYIVHFGNPQRITEGVKFMEWGVSILFVLVVFLGLTNFIRTHAGPSNLIIAIVITVGIIFVLLSAFATPAAPPPKK